MFANERRSSILKWLNDRRQLSVKELVRLTHASPATVRRDLDYLAEAGKIIRVHGGASLKQDATSLFSENEFEQKVQEFSSEKQRIGRAIAQLINENDYNTIYFDAGTSVLAVIPYLDRTDLFVITNGLHHVFPLISKGAHVILLGGTVKPTTQAVVGPQAISQLSHYNLDLSVIGVNAIDEENGLMTPDINEAELKRVAITQAERTIVAADHSKFNQRSLHSFASLPEVTIMTDDVLPVYKAFKNIKEAR